MTSPPDILPPLAEVIASEPDLQAAQDHIDAQRQGAKERAQDAEDAHLAAPAAVAPLLSGALVTASQERDAELRRRLLEHQGQVAQQVAMIPLLDDARRFADHSPDEALSILKGGCYACTHGGSHVALEVPFSYRDAETGARVSATCALTYEPRDHLLTREALEVYLFAQRQAMLTAAHAATVIGSALWAYLSPLKLSVAIKPASVREKAKWSRDADGPPSAFSLEEEVLRAALLLHVPRLIEQVQRKGGPSKLELDDAGDHALELLGRVRSGAYAITGPDSLLPLLLQAVAVAAFEPQGIRCLGLYFQAEVPHPLGEQTDFEDYARKQAQTPKGTDADPLIPLSVAKRAALKAVEFAAEKARREQEEDEITITEDGKLRASPATIIEAAAQAREDEAAKLRAENPGDTTAENLAWLLDNEAAQIRSEGQAQFGPSKFQRGWDKEPQS